MCKLVNTCALGSDREIAPEHVLRRGSRRGISLQESTLTPFPASCFPPPLPLVLMQSCDCHFNSPLSCASLGPLSLQNQQGAGHQDHQIPAGAPGAAAAEDHQAPAQAQGDVLRVFPHQLPFVHLSPLSGHGWPACGKLYLGGLLLLTRELSFFSLLELSVFISKYPVFPSPPHKNL